MTDAADPELAELATLFRAALTEKLCAQLLGYAVFSTDEVEHLVRERSVRTELHRWAVGRRVMVTRGSGSPLRLRSVVLRLRGGRSIFNQGTVPMRS